MNETKKPFACPIEDCGMSFTNEDHLSVHTKKHAMCLQLRLCSKAASFVVDQTPTPTRLIRNCDEMGLFEDLHLQHDNPFDETFRRAVETNGMETIQNTIQNTHDPLKCEESLHTPRVLPLIDIPRDGTSTVDYSKRQISETHTRISDVIVDSPTVNSKIPIKAKKKTNSRIKSKPVRRVLPKCELSETCKPNVLNNCLSRTDETSHINTTTVPNTDSLSPKTVREKLKEQILRGRRVDVVLSAPGMCNFNQNIPPTQSQTTKPEISKSIRTGTKIQRAKDENQEKFERNREAAKRYRVKMKMWKDETHLTNLKLEAENRLLKTELARVNAILLAHQNCSVTKAMSMGQNIPVGPPTFFLKPSKQPTILPTTSVQTKPSIASNQIYFILNKSINTNGLPESSGS